MAEKSCRGGFLESLCQWVALQNQQYGRSSSARAWGGTAVQTLHSQAAEHPPWIGYGQRGDAAAWLVGAGKLLGGERNTHRGHHQGVQGAAVVWGQPSQQEDRSIHIHMGQSQFMSMWKTSSKVGAAPQLPLPSYCSVLSTAKSHVIGHPKM